MSKHITYRSGNPALSSEAFNSQTINVSNQSETMTLEGTVNKASISIFLVIVSGVIGFRNFESLQGFLIPGLIIGFIIALVTIFKKHLAPTTTPIYAIVEGLVMGAFSAFFETQYPGIVMQALGLTFSIFITLLFLYKSKIIKPSENFKLGIAAATGGIALLYLVNFVLYLFGVNMPLLDWQNTSLFSIGLSFFIVIIAALNLVLDFDFIEEGAEKGAPKYMEWYGAFGLLVTLIWLYLEILKLLAKLRSR